MSEQPVQVESKKKQDNSLLWALLLIGVGGYLLAGNIGLTGWWEGIYLPVNIWALFLVIPGAIMLYNNIQRLRQGEREDRDVRNRIAIGGLMIAFGAYWFAGPLLRFRMDWDWVLALGLIGLGVLFMLRRPNVSVKID